VSYETIRRSSRIPKEIAILLTGSDMEGKGFSEMTKTVLLSRHGAGIVSTYKLYAEQEIILRYLDTNKEAVIRVVGRLGDEGDLFTYGAAFVDPNLTDFWGIDFPSATPQEKQARLVALECSTCGLRETVEHMEVESDVLMINEGIVRYCKECHDSTVWKRSAQAPDQVTQQVSAPAPEEEPVLVAATPQVKASSFVGASSVTADTPTFDAPQASTTMPAAPMISATPLAAPTPVVPTTPSASRSPSTARNEAPSPPVAPASASPAAPAPKHDNRRKHARMKVTYKACVRRSGFPDDVVTCEDMSKGGVCFKSRKRYYTDIEIEVAVPYAPGGNAIFVPAKIAWVVELPSERLFRCGVAYRLSNRPS
jgi:PilZ domain